ncbi:MULTISPECIES: thiamine pyrophosphate-binding protein [Variovorax]|jgi:acetolactate synthase I/II/III large subunit|uniref:thiamine pyrophosphate-binding protein n=1 Tax=Variovorax TaxID=34072 RepID=UPI00086A09E0|nr:MULTISPECIES: thiamine pyrophosphate-binding protein [Variovorax]MBN8753805.1 thiamine pyrophosphate-binding protein [Variovorax sp.]ODU17193.1 MAG: thiamine pyrophosphate-binding protein [Variovorax sp. SCN 67-85]ODV17835.1 MAG: thiamine pyrophosphate-binding protein [Variovorax sp. SCN 67-20]OJZ02570.1 MAG: thiamine pyrophosphate-binding protein [Variovorax sp. 67-131]UKI10967.1 thiamine pyrophosphate-binding protein [Variovorax paradoxus]
MSTSQPAGHLIVECLVEQGMNIAFGVPGESFLAVLDGFHAYRDRARFIVNRQEGGAAFMAEAHGKLTGRPGVCFVTRGPGATNASIGVHNAFQDSTPMVLFVGDVGSDFRDREAFQEVDYGSFFGPSTKGFAKRVERIDDADRIPEYIARAFATAMNGRPGPVVLVLPEDMLRSETSARPLARVEAVEPWSDPGALRTLRELLLKSQRPLVIAGGGGWTAQAAQALQRFAENWRLPVANAFRFQDTFDNHHPLYAGDVGIAINPKLAQRVKDADLILAIGPRLGEMTTGGYTLLEAPKAKQTLVHIHASAEELNRVYQADLAINAGMSAAARSLEVLSAPPTLPWEEWTLQAHADYEANLVPQALAGMPAETPRGPVDMAEVVALLQKHLPADAAITNGAGNFASWVHRYFRYQGLAKGTKTQLAPTSGAMGYGVPAGIAANLATGRVAFTIAGDGDFLMTGQELATASQHGGKSIIVLLNNGMFGTIRMHQEREYPERTSGTALRNPDFCGLARAYGYAAERVTETAQFEAALLRALAADTGTLIEIPLDPEVITTRGTLASITRAAKQQHQARN